MEWTRRHGGTLGEEVTTTSKAETIACESLRASLAGLGDGEVPDSPEFERFLSALERVLPVYLAEVYDFWQGESLDGVYAEVAQKIGAHAIELVGLGLTLNDQELLALRLRLGLREASDEIEWLEARLGEETAHGLRRTPHSLDRLKKEMHSTAQRISEIDWAFAIDYRAGK